MPTVERFPEARLATAVVALDARGRPGAVGEAERAVERSGGSIGRRLGMVDGFVATTSWSGTSRSATSWDGGGWGEE